jgi:hypothetical protein
MKMRHPTRWGVLACVAVLGCEPRVIIGTDDSGALRDAVMADVVVADVPAPQRDVSTDGGPSDAPPRDVVSPPDAVFPTDVVIPTDAVISTDVVISRDAVTAPDADGTPCAPGGQCPTGYVCEFAQGCGETTGTCRNAGCQFLPVAPQYCGCDGVTVQRADACLPNRPWRARGACLDAGSPRDVPPPTDVGAPADAATPIDAAVDAAMRVDAQVPADLGPYRGVFCGDTECDGRTHFCQLTRPPGICFPFGERCQATPTCECIRVAYCNGNLPSCRDDSGRGITAGCTGFPPR